MMKISTAHLLFIQHMQIYLVFDSTDLFFQQNCCGKTFSGWLLFCC